MPGRFFKVPTFALAIVGAVLIGFVPWLGFNATWIQQIARALVLALIVSGLNLSFGYAGELALGQVFIYALGAYLSGNMAEHISGDIFLALAIAIVPALVVGFVTGIPGLRLGGWALAMTSFFLVLMVGPLVSIFGTWTGGEVGLTAIPQLTIFGYPLSTNQYYIVAVIITALWFVVYRNLVTSRHGPAFLVIRQSPILASSLGIPVRRLKLEAYALGAVPAGIAGVLFAHLNGFIPASPTPFSFTFAIAILAASVLGGSTSIYGAIVGSAIVQLVLLRSTSFAKYTDAVYGGALIIFGLLLSEGITGIGRRWFLRWWRPRHHSTAAVRQEREALDATLNGAVLSVQSVSKRFGGINALQEVSLEAQPGKVTALIGPNGSGKTTLLNAICGFYRRDSGEITLDGRPIGGLASHRVAAAGVARTFQTPLVPKGLTVAETVATARYRTQYTSMPTSILRLPAHWRAKREDARVVAHALAVAGITELADEDATAQPLGIRRQIEVARVVASDPKVILFDEIASGLDDEAVEDLGRTVRELAAAGATVVLVEHNFGLVLEVADQIYVLANGQLIVSGPPAEIASHPDVLREYLGISEEALEPALGETLSGHDL